MSPVAPAAALQGVLPSSLVAEAPKIDLDSQYNFFLAVQEIETWQAPESFLDEVAVLAKEMDGDPFLDEELRENGAYRERFYRELARRALPDMSGAQAEDLMEVARKVDRASNSVHHMFLARAVWNEVAYKNGELNYGEEVSDLDKANARVAEELRGQNSPYEPSSLLELRLVGVQMDLADPTSRSVTVKPPSGYEIEVSKPDARALLRSIGIEPERTRPYEPIWP